MDYETNRIITQEELDKMGEELSNYAESQINQQFSKISNDMNYEKEQEIPFGAFDSDLMHEEISIPEGFEAEIKGNKIILKKIESEDEKTRKWIIDDIKDSISTHNMPKEYENMAEKALAWLENIPYTIDHEKREGFHLGYKAGFEKQGEQKVSYTTIVETGNGGINALVTRELPTNGCDEQKPAWSEEDETIISALSQLLKNCELENNWNCVYSNDREVFFVDIVNWLKSLRPQPKQEWSEEDQNALEDVREAVVHYWGGDTQDILLYWLKSIKQRIKKEAV